MHFIVWLKGAPKFDPDSPESARKVQEFVDRFVTTVNNGDATLQIHKHTATCIRRRRTRGQQSNQRNQERARIRLGANEDCRFGIPFLPFKSTTILNPLPNIDDKDKKEHRLKMRRIKQFLEHCRIEGQDITFEEFLDKVDMTEAEYTTTIRASLISAKLFLRRSVSSAFVNGYNSRIVQLFSSNMDIQFIVDEFAVATYLCSYISKGALNYRNLIFVCLTDLNFCFFQ